MKRSIHHYMKIKEFCSLKYSIMKVKIQATNWRKLKKTKQNKTYKLPKD